MKNIVILISGDGTNMEAILRTAKAAKWEKNLQAQVVAVISNRPNAKGLALAQQHGDGLIDFDAFHAFGDEQLADAPLVDRFEFHRRFVGFDLGQDVAGSTIALAATFDTDLVRRVATAAANEARSRGIRDAPERSTNLDRPPYVNQRCNSLRNPAIRAAAVCRRAQGPGYLRRWFQQRRNAGHRHAA